MESQGIETENELKIQMPDIIGYTLGEARELIGRTGIGIESIKVTAPPKEKDLVFDDSYRVVRLKLTSCDRIELIVCKPL